MSLRPFAMPKDIDSMLEVWSVAAKYPDHPEWDMEDEEQESALDMLRTVKKLWPLFRVLFLISPSMKDMMHGYVWEEGGKRIGTANIGRRGKSDTWMVSNVAVLPDHRRKGLARKLVEACLQLGRERGAKKIILDVIDGNLPAQQLYEKLGFVNYTISVTYDYEAPTSPAEAAWSSDYIITPLKSSEWQPRYQLAQRITPAIVREYEPVVESVYRVPAAARTIMSILSYFTKTTRRRYQVQDKNGQVVAVGRFGALRKKGGPNNLILEIDPNQAELAYPLLVKLVREILELSPGHKIEIQIPVWQTNLIEAVEQLGFKRRYAYARMGLTA